MRRCRGRQLVQTSLEEELAEERARREQAEWESDELRRLLESRSEATEAPETAGGGSESHRSYTGAQAELVARVLWVLGSLVNRGNGVGS